MRSSVVKGLTSKRNAFNFADLLNIGTYARCLRRRWHGMDSMGNKTFSPKTGDIEHRWHIVDAKDKVLGRLASQIARF